MRATAPPSYIATLTLVTTSTALDIFADLLLVLAFMHLTSILRGETEGYVGLTFGHPMMLMAHPVAASPMDTTCVGTAANRPLLMSSTPLVTNGPLGIETRLAV